MSKRGADATLTIEADIQPNRLSGDLARKAVTLVDDGWSLHRRLLLSKGHHANQKPVNVTTPRLK